MGIGKEKQKKRLQFLFLMLFGMKKNSSFVVLEENLTLKTQAGILTSRIRRVERIAAIGIPEWYPFGSCRAYLPMLDQVERLYLNMNKFYLEEANKQISLILHWSEMELSYAALRDVMERMGCPADDYCAPEG